MVKQKLWSNTLTVLDSSLLLDLYHKIYQIFEFKKGNYDRYHFLYNMKVPVYLDFKMASLWYINDIKQYLPANTVWAQKHYSLHWRAHHKNLIHKQIIIYTKEFE